MKMLKTTLPAILLFLLAFVSCRKNELANQPDDKKIYVEKFFKKPPVSSPEIQAIINLLQLENEKSGFVNTLPAGAGLPVWGKLIKEKPMPQPGTAARGIIADKDGNMLIPLSNDNKTISALLFAMKTDGKYAFYCYDNN